MIPKKFTTSWFENKTKHNKTYIVPVEYYCYHSRRLQPSVRFHAGILQNPY